jgi:hypothetical protein
VVAVVDCFQNRRGGVAGDVQGGRSFGLTKGSSICCEIKPTKDIRGGTGARGREWARRGRVWFTVDGGFERICPQACGAPTSDFAGLAAQSGEGEGERGEEIVGVL